MPRPRKTKQRKLTKSQQMARVRTSGTDAETALRRALWRRGLRYRLHTSLPGRPDLVFVRQRVAVFVDGCFWHGCPLHYTEPVRNSGFWRKKLNNNRNRDRRADDALYAIGWQVVRLWEHEIKGALDMAVNKIISALATRSLLDSAETGHVNRKTNHMRQA